MFKLVHMVVAIRNHPLELFEKGQVYKVIGIRLPYCNCMEYLVDIGKTSDSSSQHCAECKIMVVKDDLISWFSNRNFEPADHIVSEKNINANTLSVSTTTSSQTSSGSQSSDH